MDKTIVPVVVLDRIPLLEAPGNRKVFKVREDELGVRLDDHDTSYSDEDLPCFGLSISAPKTTSTSNSITDYKTSFDEIMNNQLKMKEERAMMLQKRIDRDALVNAPADQDQFSDLPPELEIAADSWLLVDDNLMLPSKIVIDAHPGEDILNPALKGKLFPRQKLTFENMENPITAIDTTIQRLSCYLLDEVIESRLFMIYFPRVTDKPAALRLLFRLLSVHEDCSFMIKCEDLLLSLLKQNPTEAEALGFKEVLEVLVNSGTSLSKLIPLPKLLIVAEQVVETRTPEGEEAQELTANIQEHGLECILHILRYLIRNNVSKTLLVVDHLLVLVVALSTLAMDKNLRSSVVLVQIREIIDELLLKFTASEWTDRAADLAKYLSSVSDVPQNMAFVAQMFYFSDRGHHLQRLTSFTMCHKLLGMDSPTGIHDVMPEAVLLLMKSLPRRIYDDVCIMYNVMVLVNLSVGQNLLRDDWKVVRELSTVVKKIASYIKNEHKSVITRDQMKIRDLTTNICIKWTIMANSQPKSQKSLFDNSDANDP